VRGGRIVDPATGRDETGDLWIERGRIADAPPRGGDTGVIDAAVAACKAVDECVGKVVDAILARGGAGIVTADHGNLEQMIDPETGGPHTAHTTYSVPLHLFGEPFKNAELRSGGRLADIMPTVLTMMGLPIPEEMTGRSLIL